MYKYIVSCFCCLIIVQISSSDYTRTLSTCEGTTSVERFFSVIFTEFQSSPPSCVCVQMCPDQATYCYPNNCFKPVNNTNKEHIPISRIDAHRTQPVMFVVDNDKELLDIFDERESFSKGRNERPLSEFILRPNPFKELVLKHKRLPKLEMRYNLREQVKNTKSDKLKADSINLSKTRWPLNKQVFHSKQSRGDIKHFKGNDDTRQTKFFASMFPEHEPVNYTPKYLQKYLTKRDNGGVNLEAVYTYKTDSANFSLETLIDNMIESSLDDNTINAKLDLNIYMNNSSDPSQNATLKVLRSVDGDNRTNYETGQDKNVELHIVSLNATNETIDINKYEENLKAVDLVNSSVVEMIEKMSDEIEKQNNVTLRIVEDIIGGDFQGVLDEEPMIDIHTIHENDTSYKVDNLHFHPENSTQSLMDLKTIEKQESLTTFRPVMSTLKVMKRTNKKRLVRKLKSRKH